MTERRLEAQGKPKRKRQQVWLIQSRIKGSNGPWTTTATLAFDSEHAQNLLRHARANYPGIEYRPRKFVEVQQ